MKYDFIIRALGPCPFDSPFRPLYRLPLQSSACYDFGSCNPRKVETMKRQGQVFNARELQRARSLTRWIASGCHWAEGLDNPISIAARSARADYRAMIELWRIASELAMRCESDQITQGIAGAAAAAHFWGDPQPAMRLRD